MLQESDYHFLLNREPHQPDADLLKTAISDRSILVTGGGGSIGSELCRTICQFNPRFLVVYESSEFALFKIKEELTNSFPNVQVFYVLDSILNKSGLSRAIKDYSIDSIYHAAAYKHVPLVEDNPLAGILNNIEGTRLCIEAAIAHNVENFVLISTDKAVHPVSIMGMTKRIAELLVQQAKSNTTKFSAVRFGNVLGSSGSVVPIFLQQIALGGPVTVTDKTMTRYFMTIPEAAMLTIQASAIAKGGEIFLLEMGKPINIYELAKTLIEMHGLRPNQDIEITITGSRPGEKYHEDLAEGMVLSTPVNGIYEVDALDFPKPTLNEIQKIIDAAVKGDTVTGLFLLNEAHPTFLEVGECASHTMKPLAHSL